MKTFVAVSVAAIALVVPVTPALADSSPAPADYRAECDQGYNGLKPLWDAILEPAKAVFGPLEVAVCGEQKYTPK